SFAYNCSRRNTISWRQCDNIHSTPAKVETFLVSNNFSSRSRKSKVGQKWNGSNGVRATRFAMQIANTLDGASAVDQYRGSCNESCRLTSHFTSRFAVAWSSSCYCRHTSVRAHAPLGDQAHTSRLARPESLEWRISVAGPRGGVDRGG